MSYKHHNIRIMVTTLHVGVVVSWPFIAWSTAVSSSDWATAVEFVAVDELKRVLVTGALIALQLLVLLQDSLLSHTHATTSANGNSDAYYWLPGLRIAKISIPTLSCTRRRMVYTHITTKWVHLGLIIYGIAVNLHLLVAQINYIPSNYGQFLEDNSTAVRSASGEPLGAYYEGYAMQEKLMAGTLPSAVVLCTLIVTGVAHSRANGKRVIPLLGSAGLNVSLLEFVSELPKPMLRRRPLPPAAFDGMYVFNAHL
jgi:hypothetical protein